MAFAAACGGTEEATTAGTSVPASSIPAATSTEPPTDSEPSAETSPVVTEPVDPLSTEASAPVVVEAPTSATFALVDARVIDGTGAEPLDDAVVVVRDGVITEVGLEADVVLDEGIERIGLGGATVLPGFINAHVHEVYDTDLLRTFAEGGVTTVCDLNRPGDIGIEEIFAAREAVQGPGTARLVAAGKFVTVEGGYPDAFFGDAVLVVDDVESVQRLVGELADLGAGLIKTSFESGALFRQTGWPVMDDEMASALVEAAHARSLPVIAHVTGPADLERAIDAGVDGIAHMIAQPMSGELVARVVESGTFVVPTLELNHHADQIAGWNDSPIVLENLRLLHAAGATIVLGTDFDGIPGYDVAFDVGMPVREIDLMSHAGMSPMEIIVAATSNAATACNVETVTGTVEVGKAADLVVVDGDPLTDLGTLADPRFVLRDGAVTGAAGRDR